MKPIYVFLAAAALFLALSTVSVTAGDLPAADGKALWTYITETNSYAGWGYWPGRYGMYEGKQPHGAQLKLFANGPALKAA